MNMAVTPYLCANGAADAIDFYKRAFGAEEMMRYEDGGKIGHAELRIGESTLYLSDEFENELYRVLSPLTLNANSVSLSITTDDADGVFQRAVDAGARVERPLKEEFFGRSGWLVDPFGHRWNVVQPKEDA
jgi:PhnB protein